MFRILAVLGALVPFLIYSLGVAFSEGSYLGFIDVAVREPWAGQVLLDLVIALSLFGFWMIPDARKHRIPIAPYVVATVMTGSIGALSYLVHRQIKLLRSPSLPEVATAA